MRGFPVRRRAAGRVRRAASARCIGRWGQRGRGWRWRARMDHPRPISCPAGTAAATILEADPHLNSNRLANGADALKRRGRALGRQDVIVLLLGLLSAIMDGVLLVAALNGKCSLQQCSADGSPLQDRPAARARASAWPGAGHALNRYSSSKVGPSCVTATRRSLAEECSMSSNDPLRSRQCRMRQDERNGETVGRLSRDKK